MRKNMRVMQDAFQDRTDDRGSQPDLLLDFLRILRHQSCLIFGQQYVNHAVTGGWVICHVLHCIHNLRFTIAPAIASIDFRPMSGRQRTLKMARK
jgi:hypothetical protein